MASVPLTIIFTAVFLLHYDVSCMRGQQDLRCKKSFWLLRSFSAASSRSRTPSINIRITLSEFRAIRSNLIELGSKDLCERFNFGLQTGNDNCKAAFRQFQTIPEQHRGQCAGATAAGCYKTWICGSQACNQCCFYNPGDAPGEGHWTPVKHCGEGMPEKPNL